MATKKEVLEAAVRGEGCLGRAANGEPVFVLRAQDRLAAALVDDWANEAVLSKCPADKVAEARAIAAQMRTWPNRRLPD